MKTFETLTKELVQPVASHKHLYWIGYDLILNERYDKLLAKLRELGAVHVLKSGWLLETNDAVDLFFDDLKACLLHRKDRLMISQLGGEKRLHLPEDPEQRLVGQDIVREMFNRSACRCGSANVG
jgi:hypothetical protein